VLLAAIRSFRPAVVLVDKHPFGAGGEFRAPLETAKAYGARAVLGLRDILDDIPAVLQEWSPDRIQQRIAEYYDLVLVYGTQSIFDPIEAYRLPPSVAERTAYCGYVVNQSVCGWHSGDCPYLLLEPTERPIVLGTAGGGEDGFALLKTFIGAAVGAPWQAIVVAGPMMGQQDLKTLKRLAGENGVIFHAFLPCLSSLFGNIDGLVCMGGYNTLVEALSQGLPTVCVPRATPRSEQLLRARMFDALGLVCTVQSKELTAENLRGQIATVLETGREQRLARAHKVLDFDGARRAANYLLGLVAKVSRTPEGRLAPVVS